ncbi:NAD+ synthase (glutamine-hydrolysing) [Mariprofundus ferrinatatus]|uniref:Glutamine-dependent NAD(+) synthetase n=1 Tax=Mariprofundus ferrinatatus TaxID=1921087 RepID=A0A2K8L5M5_9PROT|nr:NAD+ synthase [Mariprofundus ferrinatatus]ATX82412.1 NAD+ synthase (glutamine-hydrolysing) [Mariprofundus ferrinatatus]
MKLLIAQIAPRVGDLEGNVRLIHEALREAEHQGCDLAVFPELTVTGYPPEDLLKRPAFMIAVDKAVGQVIAGTSAVCAVFGAPRRDGESLRNSVLLAQNGKLLGVYDKQRLPNYGVFDEQRYFSAGNGTNAVVEVNGHRIGVGICEDLWHDDLARRQAEMDCDLWVNLNASPFHTNKQLEREALVRRRAMQFGVPLVYVNPVGGQDEIVFDGGSHVVDGAGDLVLRAPLFESWVGTVDTESEEGRIISPLPEAIEQVHRALVMGVRDYVHRNGCRQVVIGLSGGIDSALTAVIAVQALGAENVLGVLLPSRYSSDHSISDAEALVANLGIEAVTLPIASGVSAAEDILADTFAEWGKSEADVTEENIQARIRGLLLMAISNKTGRMLLTTGNKSEMAVGYATLYGDMAGGFAVLKDVYKTQAFELSRWINRSEEVIPWNTISKPPSAELRPDQKDSDSLPDYEVLDAILKANIEERLGVDEIAARGYNRAEVERVVRMLQLAEYKRRQAPPGVKITERAFGRDRRYPITHHFYEWEK